MIYDSQCSITGLLDHKSVNGDPQVTIKQPASKYSCTYFDSCCVLFWEINVSCCGDTVKVKKKNKVSFYGTVQQGTSIHTHNNVLPQTSNIVKVIFHMKYRTICYYICCIQSDTRQSCWKIYMLHGGLHIEEVECRHTD